MGVRRATAADAALFCRLNEQGGHGRMDPTYAAALLEEEIGPPCSAWVDDEAQAGAYFQVWPERREVVLAWLLPRSADLAVMKRLVRAGFRDIRDRSPLAGGWTFYGDITPTDGRDLGERAVRAWEAVFRRAGCPFTIERTSDGHWRGTIPTLQAADQVARKWR